MQQPPYGQPPGGSGMPPGGQPPYGQPPYGPPPGGPPQWGGMPPQGGGPPKLPPKQGFPWAIVIVIGFLVAVGIGAYIYKKQKGNPLKEWERELQESTERSIDREIERMENDPAYREQQLEEWKKLEKDLEEAERKMNELDVE